MFDRRDCWAILSILRTEFMDIFDKSAASKLLQVRLTHSVLPIHLSITEYNTIDKLLLSKDCKEYVQNSGYSKKSTIIHRHAW